MSDFAAIGTGGATPSAAVVEIAEPARQAAAPAEVPTAVRSAASAVSGVVNSLLAVFGVGMLAGSSSNDVVMRTADRPEGPWSPPTTLVSSLQYRGLYAPMMSPW